MQFDRFMEFYMRCEITLRNLRKMTNQISTLEVRREAQEIRAVVLVIAVRIVFQRITPPCRG